MVGRNLLRGVCAAALVLGGCSSDDEAQAEVPTAIQEMMAVEFPADGQIHVESRGEFQIKSETLFCEMGSIVVPQIAHMGIAGLGLDGVAVSERLKALGQSDYLDGSSRQRTVSGGHCPVTGENIVHFGEVLNNRKGAPYKLILAVWQGDPAKDGAVWIGGVERSNGRIPDFAVSIDGPTLDRQRNLEAEQRYLLEVYLREDSRRLGAAFVSALTGKE